MYDLHSHILPGVDDGPKKVEVSLDMLRSARAQGVNVVAATSHCLPESEEKIDRFLEKRSAAFELLKSKMPKDEQFPKIILGAEVLLETDICEYSNLRSLCYEKTDFILLEIVEDIPLQRISEWVYNIKIKGLKPVIAHVDRYSKCFEIMEELIPLGVIFQLNAGRFLSMMGRSKLKKIFAMNERFLVSSDMHNTTTRCCNIDKALAVVNKKFPRLNEMLFCDTGRFIVENGKL